MESDSGFNAMDMAVAMGHRNGVWKNKRVAVGCRLTWEKMSETFCQAHTNENGDFKMFLWHYRTYRKKLKLNIAVGPLILYLGFVGAVSQ